MFKISLIYNNIDNFEVFVGIEVIRIDVVKIEVVVWDNGVFVVWKLNWGNDGI